MQNVTGQAEAIMLSIYNCGVGFPLRRSWGISSGGYTNDVSIFEMDSMGMAVAAWVRQHSIGHSPQAKEGNRRASSQGFQPAARRISDAFWSSSV